MSIDENWIELFLIVSCFLKKNYFIKSIFKRFPLILRNEGREEREGKRRKRKLKMEALRRKKLTSLGDKI